MQLFFDWMVQGQQISRLFSSIYRMFHRIDKVLCGRKPSSIAVFHVKVVSFFLVGTFICALPANTSNKATFVVQSIDMRSEHMAPLTEVKTK